MHNVFVHGSASSSRMWRPITQVVDGVAVDLPGAVGTPGIQPGDDWSIADDLHVVCDAVGSNPTNLFGHSYGGLLTLRVAREHDGIEQVIAHEPVNWQLLYQLGTPRDRELLGDPDLIALLLDPAHAGTDAWLHAFVDFWNGPGAWSALASRQGMLRTAAYKTFLEVRAAFDDPTPLADWAACTCPVRLTVGHDAPPAQRRVVELWQQVLPNVEVVEVPGGHLAPLTHPVSTLEAWKRWFSPD